MSGQSYAAGSSVLPFGNHSCAREAMQVARRPRRYCGYLLAFFTIIGHAGIAHAGNPEDGYEAGLHVIPPGTRRGPGIPLPRTGDGLFYPGSVQQTPVEHLTSFSGQTEPFAFVPVIEHPGFPAANGAEAGDWTEFVLGPQGSTGTVPLGGTSAAPGTLTGMEILGVDQSRGSASIGFRPPQIGAPESQGGPPTSVRALRDGFGLTIEHESNASPLQIRLLGQAINRYPKELFSGLRIDFTGKRKFENNSEVAAQWNTGGILYVYQVTTSHQFCHELAHHILERTQRRWGQRLVQALWNQQNDYPPPRRIIDDSGAVKISDYADKNMTNAISVGSGDRRWWGYMVEVAAETVSWWVEKEWRPRSRGVLDVLQQDLDPSV